MRNVVTALVLCLLTWSAVAQDATSTATSTATQTTTGAADQQKKPDEPKKTDEPKKSDEPKKTDEPKKADEPKKPDDPVITKVYRDPAYPEEQTYKIHLLGTGFDPDEKKNQLFVNQIQLPACKDGATTACIKKVENVTDGRELLFTLADHGQYHRQHKVKLAIEVGDRQSNEVEIRLSRVWESFPFWLAVLGAIALGMILVYLSAALKGNPAAARAHGKWDTFFMDPETDTYSLSKLQFYLWTFATIFGYLYLSASRGLVQGLLDFNDIPPGLPAVFGISAATSALAIGVTNTRGSKGSGDMGPSRADFLTSGGVVAPDRVQFLVWTVVGVITFLTLVILRDPGTIQDLPKVPDGFLLLMGVSSAGYLGGKMARKAGPKITDIKVTHAAAAGAAPATMTLEITGEHLSKNAKLFIGADELGTADYVGGAPPIVKGDPDPDFTTMLTVALINNPVRCAAGSVYQLTVVNSDAQRAVKEFTA